jgi:hypothetical protein
MSGLAGSAQHGQRLIRPARSLDRLAKVGRNDRGPVLAALGQQDAAAAVMHRGEQVGQVGPGVRDGDAFCFHERRVPETLSVPLASVVR